MSFFIELRCDIREPLEPIPCKSDRNQGPVSYSMGDRPSVAEALRTIESCARNHGWRRIKSRGWACPSCSARLA